MMPNNDRLVSLIHEAITKECEKIIEEQMVAFTKTVQQKLRDVAPIVAVRVLDHYSFERYGAELKIIVKQEFIE